MRFIRDLSWETQKMLERIYRYSEHHQTRQRAKCLLLVSVFIYSRKVKRV